LYAKKNKDKELQEICERATITHLSSTWFNREDFVVVSPNGNTLDKADGVCFLVDRFVSMQNYQILHHTTNNLATDPLYPRFTSRSSLFSFRIPIGAISKVFPFEGLYCREAQTWNFLDPPSSCSCRYHRHPSTLVLRERFLRILFSYCLTSGKAFGSSGFDGLKPMVTIDGCRLFL
jgi:hypothetical protein